MRKVLLWVVASAVFASVINFGGRAEAEDVTDTVFYGCEDIRNGRVRSFVSGEAPNCAPRQLVSWFGGAETFNDCGLEARIAHVASLGGVLSGFSSPECAGVGLPEEPRVFRACARVRDGQAGRLGRVTLGDPPKCFARYLRTQAPVSWLATGPNGAPNCGLEKRIVAVEPAFGSVMSGYCAFPGWDATTVLSACRNRRSGALTRLTVGVLDSCPRLSEVVSWSTGRQTADCGLELRLLALAPGFELSEGCSVPGRSVSVGVSVDVDHDGDGVLDTVVNCDGLADPAVSDVGLVSVTVTNSGPGDTVVGAVSADVPVGGVHRWVEPEWSGLGEVAEGGQVTLTRRFSASETGWLPAFGVSGDAEVSPLVEMTSASLSASGSVGWASTQIDGCGPVSWTQLGADIDGEAAGDYSGRSVSLSADGATVAIGAPFNDGAGDRAGHVRVFRFESGSWVQLGADIDGEAAGDYSGLQVSLSADGGTVAIGAPWNDGARCCGAGHVRVFRFDSGASAWVQLGADIDGETAGDYSGWSVSLSADGGVVAIGASEDKWGDEGAGHVRVFRFESGSWVQLGADIEGEALEDNRGTSVSVSLSADGATVAIGFDGNDGAGDEAGHVRVFRFESGSWVQLGADIDGVGPWEFSGSSVSLSADGGTVAIGAPWNDGAGDEAGHVRVFRFEPRSRWVQLGADIDGEAADDYSGRSVSLSADGGTVAIGANENDGAGSYAGHVRVYRFDSGASAWVQLGADIDGEARYDYSGGSVSLSADGATVAIGAYGNDGAGNEAGHVRVYRFTGP